MIWQRQTGQIDLFKVAIARTPLLKITLLFLCLEQRKPALKTKQRIQVANTCWAQPAELWGFAKQWSVSARAAQPILPLVGCGNTDPVCQAREHRMRAPDKLVTALCVLPVAQKCKHLKSHLTANAKVKQLYGTPLRLKSVCNCTLSQPQYFTIFFTTARS